MTKDRFIAIHTHRGYKVEDLGKIVILSMGNYTAMWFFNADGTLNENEKPTWTVSKR